MLLNTDRIIREHIERIRAYYAQEAEFIKRTCGPYFVEITHDDFATDISRAEVALEHALPIDMDTAHLLVCHYVDNTF